MALVGNLKDLKLPSLIQLNCMERNSAKMTIEHNGKYGFIYFDKGQVVHAEFEPDIGEKAIYRLLGLYTGNFKVENNIRPPVVSIKTNWNNLLLEGLHQLDSLENGQGPKYDSLFERLLAIRGVRKALIFNDEGEVIASSAQVAEDEQVLSAIAVIEAERFGSAIGVEKPDFISIGVSPERYVLTAYNKFYILLKIDIKIKMDVVLPFISQALR